MPNNWKKHILGDLIDVKHGYAFKGEFFSETPTKDILLSPGNFNIGGGFKADKFKYYNGTIPQDYILNEDDLLITMTDLSPKGDTLGTTALIPKHNGINYLHNQRLGLVTLKSNQISKNYLYWALRSDNYHNFIVASATGSTVRHTSPSRIKEFEIEIPELKEQQAIAEILSSLDDKIELNLQTNKTLEEMADALYKHWFVDFGPFQNGKFIESELGLIPEGWEISRLENVVDIGSSKRIFLNEYVSSGIPFYRGKEIIELSKNNSINTELFIDVDKFEDIKARFGAPKEGDILLTSVGTIGKSYLIGADEVFYFKDGNLTWIKNYLSYLKPHFVFQWLNSIETLEQIQSIKIGSTQEAITIQGIRSLKIIVPPKSVHDEIEIKIREYRNLIKSNNNENDSLKQTRDYLLPKLISGEISVKDAAKKVKEVL